LYDEALIHPVEEDTVDKTDLGSYNSCWVLSKDPARIPQVVFLNLPIYEIDPSKDMVQFSRPRAMKKSHYFRILVHIDAIEDLLFITIHLKSSLLMARCTGRIFLGNLVVLMETLKRMRSTHPLGYVDHMIYTLDILGMMRMVTEITRGQELET
jgi:hypothetical protein